MIARRDDPRWRAENAMSSRAVGVTRMERQWTTTRSSIAVQPCPGTVPRRSIAARVPARTSEGIPHEPQARASARTEVLAPDSTFDRAELDLEIGPLDVPLPDLDVVEVDEVGLRRVIVARDPTARRQPRRAGWQILRDHEADSGSKRVLEVKHNRHVAKSGRNTRSKIRSPPRNTTLVQSENSISRRYASIT